MLLTFERAGERKIRELYGLRHRFLTGGPWTPKGSVKRFKGVREDQKSKVQYPFKQPLLQVFRGLLVVLFDSLGVRGIFFDF